jgi:RNA 2',3'-cyclic 3'-phosphodiesterase
LLRLFTALELSEDAKAILASLRAPFADATWVATDDLHITLQFAGEISRRVADEFAHELASLHLPAPPIEIRGTAAFGGKQPNAVYAAIQPSPELDMLQRAHERAARAVGLKIETRKYVPHVTLARLHGAETETVARFLEKTGALRVPTYWPARAVLMSAREGGGGPYGVVDEFPFMGQYDMDEA